MTSSGRTSPRAAGEEEERRFATVVTGRVTLPESAQTLMRATEGAAAVVVVDEGRASRCATAATGLVTLQGSAPRVMAVTVAMLGDLFVTDVTGLATLLGSALRATVDAMLAEVAMEVAAIWDEVAAVDMEVPRVTLDVAATDTEIQGVSEVDVILAAEAVDLSATSATGLATLPESAGRRRTAATSVTGLGTLRGTAARTRTPATTAMRWVTS